MDEAVAKRDATPVEQACSRITQDLEVLSKTQSIMKERFSVLVHSGPTGPDQASDRHLSDPSHNPSSGASLIVVTLNNFADEIENITEEFQTLLARLDI